MSLARFNAAPANEITEDLLACCDVPSWAATLVEQRPYGDLDDLIAAADAAARRFTERDVDRALRAHPRIGERPQGSGTEASWSRQEQSGVDDDAQTQRALAEGNREYEQRFDRVFLICATGLSAQQILAALTTRLGNDAGTEDAVVKDELRKIALLRLRKLVDGG